jgi:hypothetical protein
MLSRCLNPACSAPFRYLRNGRIYQLEIPAAHGNYSAKPRREYFWLCGRCCSEFSVVLRDGHGCIEDLPSPVHSTVARRRRTLPD